MFSLQRKYLRPVRFCNHDLVQVKELGLFWKKKFCTMRFLNHKNEMYVGDFEVRHEDDRYTFIPVWGCPPVPYRRTQKKRGRQKPLTFSVITVDSKIKEYLFGLIKIEIGFTYFTAFIRR